MGIVYGVEVGTGVAIGIGVVPGATTVNVAEAESPALSEAVTVYAPKRTEGTLNSPLIKEEVSPKTLFGDVVATSDPAKLMLTSPENPDPDTPTSVPTEPCVGYTDIVA